MLLIAFLTLCQAKPEAKSLVMPFIKVEAVGYNPANPEEQILFEKPCAEKMMREFKRTPVYIVKESVKGRKVEITREEVGVASCIFLGDNWLSASVELTKPLPPNHVLRARTSSSKNKMRDATLIVQEASVVEFHIKEEKSATMFK
jgi:hypothetical protein